jgi:hypothetical protein
MKTWFRAVLFLFDYPGNKADHMRNRALLGTPDPDPVGPI